MDSKRNFLLKSKDFILDSKKAIAEAEKCINVLINNLDRSEYLMECHRKVSTCMGRD